MFQINSSDLMLIKQPIINTRIKIDVYDEKSGTHIDRLECGVINSSLTVSAESDVRRTANLTLTPVSSKRLTLSKSGILWFNRIIKIQLGIYDMLRREWKWYQQGTYAFTDYGAAYNAAANEISLSCSDMWVKLDGTKNGQVGALTTSFPAYEQDEETGDVIHYHSIRDAVMTILLQLGKLKESQIEIDDMGEYKGMPEYYADYLKYREESKVQVKDGSYEETWNAIPYDQEFSSGTTVASMLTAFRDLYPNYEMYFDESGTFICKMIPGCYEDDVLFDSNFFDRIYISENTSVDLTSVRNVCEVWGQVIEADFYTESCTCSENIYSCSVDTYDKYCNGDTIAIHIPSANQSGSLLNINHLGALQMVDENTEEPIREHVMEPDQVYAFKIKKKRINGSNTIRAYLLGQWQPHAVNVLTNGAKPSEDYVTQDGTVVKKYSKEYFQKIYGCNTVTFTVVKDSPFSIEELGLILDVKTGGEYENITSDSLAAARAEYENWKNCRLNDSISITTKICPFADVNVKVSYRRKDTGEIHQYIVKNISHDPSAGTTSWTLMRFYPLYKDMS